MKKIVLLLAYLLLTKMLIAQNTATQNFLADTYTDAAKVWFDSAKYELSTGYFKRAADLYENCEIWEKMLDCWNRISENFWRSGNTEKSFFLGRKSLM